MVAMGMVVVPEVVVVLLVTVMVVVRLSKVLDGPSENSMRGSSQLFRPPADFEKRLGRVLLGE